MRGLGITTLLAALAVGGAAHAQSIAIEGATVYASPTRKLENATVVITRGVIAAVGPRVAVPAAATRIAGKGKVVTAGLVDAFSQIGLIEVDLEPTGADGRFGAPTDIHAAYRAIDAYDARSVAGPVARAGGVTSVVTAPSGGVIAGQSAWVVLDDSLAPRAPVRAPAAMHAALGAGAIASTSRGKAVELLRELIDDADAFRRNRAAYERNQARRMAGSRLDLEALVPVLRGALPLVVRAESEADIRAALRLARDRRLRIVIAGGTEAWRLAGELAAAKVPVILDPTANLPDDLGAPDVRDDAAAVLVKAGVPVAISTLGGAWNVRTLRQLAGIAVGYGLTWEQALAAITQVPAAIYGVKDRGELKKGAAGDVVVWSGDPLELSTRAEVVIVGGVVQPAENHQTRLREKYRTLR